MTPDSRFLAECEVRMMPADDGKTYFEGYAAVFNSLSEDMGGFKEKINPRAFDKGLSGSDVRCLVNHEACMLLGRTKSRTLSLVADAKGLKFKCESPETGCAMDLAKSVKRGDITGCSFRFYVAEGGDLWSKSPDGQVIRELIDIEIDEISIVTFPAYKATEVSVRSLERLTLFKVEKPAPAPVPVPALALALRRLQLAESLR